MEAEQIKEALINKHVLSPTGTSCGELQTNTDQTVMMKLPLDGIIHPQGRQGGALTVGEVAAERRGKIPPQAIMMLSTICEMRWMALWTNMMFSLLLTKSMTDLVAWLRGKEEEKNGLL